MFYKYISVFVLASFCTILAFNSQQARAQCTGCTSTITAPSSTNISVSAGQVVCINGSGNYTGQVNMNGGTLCIGTGVNYNPNNTTYNGSWTINNSGTFTNISNLNFNSGTTFNNLATGSISFSNSITINSGATFTTLGSFTFSSNNRDLQINSGATVTLGGSVTITRDLINAGALTIVGTIIPGDDISNTGTIRGGSGGSGCNYLDATNNFTNSGTIGGSGQALLLGSSPGGTVSSPATTTAASEPSNSISSPSLSISGSDIIGTITNPGGGTAITNYLVVRRLNSTVDNASRPVDNTSYSVGQTIGNGIVVAINPIGTLTFTDANALANGCQSYNYACFGFRATTGGCPNYNRTLGSGNRASISTSSNAGSVTGGNSLCSGGNSGLLTLSGYSGSIVKWQSSVSPFSSWTDIANTTATYTSGTLTQTTQFRAVVNGGAGCSDAFSAATTATVSNAPTANAGSAIISCGSSAITMTGSTAANATAVAWTGGSGLGTWSGTGNNPATYSFTPSVASGSFSATLTVTGAAGCSNATSSRTISWGPLPTVASTTPAALCSTGSVSLAGTASAGATLDWYANSTSGSPLTNGTGVLTFNTPSISTTTTYYAQARNTTTGCISAVRTAVAATINTPPSAAAGTDLTVCSNAGLTMAGATATNATAVAWTGGSGLGTWSGTGNDPATYTFTPSVASGSFSATLTVTGAAGCSSASSSRTITWSTVPTVTSTTPSARCGTGNLNLVGTASAGATLDWYDVSTGSTALTNGTGVLTYKTLSISTTTTFYVQARNTTSGCISALRTAVVATVDIAPGASAGPNLTACSNAAITTTGATATGTISSVDWSGGAGLGTWSGTGNDPATYTFTPSVNSGSFTATLTVTAGGTCTGTTTSTRTISWNDVPGAPGYTTESRCGTGTLSLNATPNTGETIDWYASLSATTPLTGGTGVTNFITPSISTTTTYYAAARDLTTGCSSPRVAVIATVSSTPGVTQYRDGNNCGPGIVGISAVTTDDAVIDWYANSTGGTPLLSGSNTFFTPSLTTTTTYYAQPRSTASGCTPASRIPVRAVITSPSIVGVNGAGPYCPGATASLSASGSNIINQYWTGPNGFFSTAASLSIPNLTSTNAGTYTVYASCLSGVNLVYNGDFELGNIGFSSSYVNAYKGSNTDLYPEGTYGVLSNPTLAHNLFSSCADHTAGAGTQMMVVNGAPTSDVIIWSQTVNVDPNLDYQFSYWETSVVAANPSVLQLYVNGVAAGPPLTAPSTNCNWVQFFYNWNSGSATQATLTLVNQNTILYGNDFSLDDIVFQPACQSVASGTITVGLPPAPTTTPGQRCGNGSVQLGSNTSHAWFTTDWYAASSGGAVLTNGTAAMPTFNTPSITGTTTYYAQTRNASGGGCVSTSRTAALATVNPLPTVSSTTGASLCGAGSVNLTGTASSGATLDWYDAATNGNLVTGGSGVLTFPTPSVTVPTSYFAQARNTTTGCISAARTSTLANMSAAPAASASTAYSQCNNAAITMTGTTASGTFGSLAWSGGVGSGSWSGTGTNPATYVFTPSTASGSFTATLTVTGNGVCAGQQALSSRTIAWSPPPSAVTVTGGGTVCGSTTLAASGGTGGTIYWQNSTTGGTDVSTASSSQLVSASGTYYFRPQSSAGCWGTQGSANVTITPANAATISYSTPSICKSTGGTLSVTRTGTTTGTYSSPGLTINSTSGLVDVSASPVGNYTITYSMPVNGVCPAVQTTTALNIGNALGTLATPTGSTSVCQGTNSTAYTASAANANSYTWAVSGTGNSVSGTSTTGTVSWGSSYTGPATVTVTANGCGNTTATRTLDVTVQQTGTWLGGSNSWINPANWCGSLPGLATDVIIPPGVPFMPRADGSALVRNLSIQSGASVTVLSGNSLTVYGAFNNQGTFTVQPNSSMAFSGVLPQTVPSLDYANLSTSGGAKTFSGTVRISGTFTPGGSSHTTTGSTFEFNGTTAQNIPAFGFHNLTISGNSAKSMTGDVTIANALNLTNGSLSLGANKLVLNGTVSGAGTLSTGCTSELQVAGAGNTGTLNFTSGQNTLGKLGLLKTAVGSVNLGTDLNICTQLTLTQGKVVLGSSNLTLLPGANTTNGTQTSYVQTIDQVAPGGAGFFIQQLPTNGGTRTFPVGTNSYTPAYLTNVGTTGNFKVRVFNDIFEFGIAGSLIQNIFTSVRKTWEIAPITVGGSPDVAMKLEWNDADEGAAFAAARANTNLPYIGKNIGVGSSVWVPQVVSAKNLSTPPYSLTTPSITTFSKFAVGSSMTPLPVSMGNLHVVADAKTNKLLWETYSEINSKGFRVLRSRNGKDFTEVGYVNASGNSNQKMRYRYVDKAPLPGTSYYKLQFEGVDPKDVSYSNVVSVSPASVLEFKVYPNPAQDQLNVELSSDEALDVDLRLIDLQGRTFHLPILEGEAGTYRLDISHLTPGIYVIEKVVNGAVLSKARIVKQ